MRTLFLRVAAAGMLGLIPSVAMAHLGLSRSTPAHGATVSVAPTVLRLEFTEAVERTIARIRLLGPDSTEVRLSDLRQPADSMNIVLADVLDGLAPGAYAIEWRVVGADGHPVSGTIRFVVAGGAAADSAQAPPPAVNPPAMHHDEASMPEGTVFASESAGYVAVRWVHFLGLVALLGVLAFRTIVLRLVRRLGEDDEVLAAMDSRALEIGRWSAIAFVVSVVLRLGAQSLTLLDGTGGFDSELLGAMLVSSTWGRVWIVQFVLAIAVAAGFGAVMKRRAGAWPVVAGGILLLAITPALSGHAVATPLRTGLAILADALHVMGAGGWMGSLLLVLLAGLPVALRRHGSDGPASVRRLIEAFSPTALAFAALIVVTGVYAAWIHVGLSAALWESSYGRVLLLKLGILSIALGIGAYNWRVVRPRLGSDGATRVLRPSVIAELSVGALVLLITAVLVATPPPPASDASMGGTMVSTRTEDLR